MTTLDIKLKNSLYRDSSYRSFFINEVEMLEQLLVISKQ